RKCRHRRRRVGDGRAKGGEEHASPSATWRSARRRALVLIAWQSTRPPWFSTGVVSRVAALPAKEAMIEAADRHGPAAREVRRRRVGRIRFVQLDVATGDRTVAIVGSSLVKLAPIAESDGKF